MRQRRLLLVCAVSAALHLLALEWLAHPAPRLRAVAPQPSLSVRLAAPPAQHGAAAAPAPPVPAADIGRAAAAPASIATPAPAPGAGAKRPAAAAPPPGWDIAAAADDAALAHTPGYQSVQAPPDALLSYAITRQAPGQPATAAGAATLAWHADDGGYRLALDGVMGELDSRGQMTDSGFAPVEARARVGAHTAVTAFDWGASRVRVDGGGAGAAITSDGQDRASMLMRLAGMGLAGAAQLDGTVELLVAGADGVAVVRFQRAEDEVIDSALGKLATAHLVQLAAPGRARLEVWLAPSRSWYPVQLRVTAPDGSALTQTVTAIAPR